MCSVPVKLKLFNSYCASLYTPHLWWNYRKMSVTKLHITYHNILKRNIGLSKYESTSATCAYTNTQSCQSTIRNLVFKFVCRLNKSDNALIKALLASSVVYSSLLNFWAGLQCYCRAEWRAGRSAFVGRIWPAARGCPPMP